jgi:DNA helicase-2/ATP-dependent DNA helicase PcrA
VFSGLNPPQQTAVETLRGPLLVLAGAGSGKTRVVTFRIANLIRHGTRPSRILAVTFTNKAAKEMQERIGKLLGKKQGTEKPQISTFHAHCVRVLRRHIRRLGYPEKFAIYDQGDQESLARGVLRDIRVSGELMRPSDLLFQISQWKSHAVRPPEASQHAKTDKEHLAAMGYRRYQKALKNAGAVDFDDLLLLTEELFSQHADVRAVEGGLFDHILIDEYQDTNGSQYRIIRALAEQHRNLCVVGDDDQSIYGWRGADVQHILRFAKDWPDAKVVRLEMNYRSTSAILELANRLIKFNRVRHDKTLQAARPGGDRPRVLQYQDENEEARETIADIRRRLTQPGVEPRDIAILFRTNEQPRPFETELRKARIPYVMLGSTSFFDRKEVRDILAYLKLIESPADEVSLLRVLNLPPRGIGDRTREELMTAAVAAGKSLWQTMTGPECPPFGDAPANAVRKFIALIENFRERFAKERDLAAVARDLISAIDYQSEIRRNYPDQQEQDTRWKTVEEAVNALGAYQAQAAKPSLAEFVSEITLGERDFGDMKEKELARNAIVMLTLHSAKGLEYPHVYMVGLEEGILPHHRTLKAEGRDDVEEERRLAYVGVTRAQEFLTLSLPLTRLKWGKARESIPSRFLFEMIGQAERAPAAGGGPHQRPAAAKSPRGKTAGKRPPG